MNLKYLFIIPVFFLSCGTMRVATDKSLKFQQPLKKKTVSLMIGYSYNVNGKPYDMPFTIPDTLYISKDLNTVIQAIKNTNAFENVVLNSDTEKYELNVKVSFKDHRNFVFIFLTAATLYIIPHYWDKDMEIELTLTDRTSKKMSKKYLKKGELEYWIGPIPLIGSMFWSVGSVRKKMIQSMVDELLTNMSFDEVYKE